MKNKIRLAIQLADEIIDYFESMSILTDDEKAMLESAEWTKEQLRKKEEK